MIGRNPLNNTGLGASVRAAYNDTSPMEAVSYGPLSAYIQHNFRVPNTFGSSIGRVRDNGLGGVERGAFSRWSPRLGPSMSSGPSISNARNFSHLKNFYHNGAGPSVNEAQKAAARKLKFGEAVMGASKVGGGWRAGVRNAGRNFANFSETEIGSNLVTGGFAMGAAGGAYSTYERLKNHQYGSAMLTGALTAASGYGAYKMAWQKNAMRSMLKSNIMQNIAKRVHI